MLSYLLTLKICFPSRFMLSPLVITNSVIRILGDLHMRLGKDIFYLDLLSPSDLKDSWTVKGLKTCEWNHYPELTVYLDASSSKEQELLK